MGLERSRIVKGSLMLRSPKLEKAIISGKIRLRSIEDIRVWQRKVHFRLNEQRVSTDSVNREANGEKESFSFSIDKDKYKKREKRNRKEEEENKQQHKNKGNKLQTVERYKYKKHGYIKQADIREFAKKKEEDFVHSIHVEGEGRGVSPSHIPEEGKIYGAVKEIKYKNRKKYFNNCGKEKDIIQPFYLSDKDEVIINFQREKKGYFTKENKKTGKTINLHVNRKNYMKIMNDSIKGRIKTFGRDIFHEGEKNIQEFSHRLAGQGYKSGGEYFQHKIKGTLQNGGTLQSDVAAEFVSIPKQLKYTEHIVKVSGKAAKLSGKAVLSMNKNIIKASKDIGFRVHLRKSRKKIKRFANTNNIQRKKIIQETVNKTIESTVRISKKAAKKAVKEIGSLIIKIVGGMFSGSIAIVGLLIIPVLVMMMIMMSTMLPMTTIADGDSIVALNNETIQWEVTTKQDIQKYVEELKESNVCAWERGDESYYFIINANELRTKVDILWERDIADYDGEENTEPDVSGIIESWKLQEAVIKNSWLPVYVLVANYLNYDIGKLGGSNESVNLLTKDEILNVAKEIFNIMYNSFQVEKSVTMTCVESEDDGTSHEHEYTYYVVFVGVRTFEETLSMMPWHTNTYQYCMDYEENFKDMKIEEQGEYLVAYPEKKDKEVKEFYAEIVVNMSKKEGFTEEILNEDWKYLLNIRSIWDEMGENEFESAYNNFPVINMKREEFVTLVKSYCEPTGKIPYLFGGKCTSPDWNEIVENGLDCTGFVDWIYRTAGEEVLQSGPGEMWYATYAIKEIDLKPGDLVWKTQPYESATSITHVGIFLGYDENGNKLFGHCASGTGTIINSYDGFIFYRRACVRFLDELEESSSS